MSLAKHAPLLVELLTEELPPKALARFGEVFSAGVFAGLVQNRANGKADITAQLPLQAG